MPRLSSILLFALGSAALLTACAKSSQSTTAPASPEAGASAEQVAASATPAVVSTAPAAATAAATSASPAASPTIAVSFTDVKGIYAETIIDDMAALGVFDTTSGAFRPTQPIKRAEFVRWLVKANNAYFSNDPKQQIRPAEGTDQAFVDVPTSNPDYKYIQALANAGFVIGIDAHHFAPNDVLTREQMVAIKVGVDLGGDPYKKTTIGDVHVVYPFNDIDKISKRYYDAIYGDDFSRSKNIPRVWGNIKAFQPQKPVTRAEAALCLDKVGNYSATTAAEALGKPTPAGR